MCAQDRDLPPEPRSLKSKLPSGLRPIIPQPHSSPLASLPPGPPPASLLPQVKLTNEAGELEGVGGEARLWRV